MAERDICKEIRESETQSTKYVGRQRERQRQTKAQIEKKIQTKTYRRNQKDKETCQSRGQRDTDPNEDEDTKINGLYLYFKTYDCQLAIVVDDACTTSIINECK